MKLRSIACAALLAIAAPTQAQTAAELRAQLEQTKAMLAEGQAAGMDESVLASLRESLAMVEETVREMEAEERSAGTSSEVSADAAATPYPVKTNLAATDACRGFTEANYRQVALAEGNDQQLRAMCGQAFEYYTMYKRAIAQGYSEADANRTYDAHEKSALVANDFYTNNRAD